MTPDGMLMAAGIDTTKAFAATVPQPLFRTGLTYHWQLPPVRRRQGRPAVSHSGTERDVSLYADHRGLELASDSTEVEEDSLTCLRATRCVLTCFWCCVLTSYLEAT